MIGCANHFLFLQNNSKVRNTIIYGGVTQDEYILTKPLRARFNLRIWKTSSIFFEILFIIAFIGSLLMAFALPVRDELKELFKHCVIPLGICSFYLVVTSLIFLNIKSYSKALLPLIYITNGMILLCIGSISAVNPLITCAAFLVVLVALPFFTSDSPLRYSIFTISMVLLYVGAIVITDIVTAGSMTTYAILNIILSGFFTIVSCFISYMLNINRIKHNVDIYDIEIQRDTDPLTGVKNKNAYDRKVEDISLRIKNKDNIKFAIALFDINDLKVTNDQFGHNAGDKLIIRSARLICSQFKRSPVYRIGGDEFVVILENADYNNREALVRELHEMIDRIHQQSTSSNNDTSLAFGVAVYNAQKDFDYLTVFSRADAEMYDNKRFIKAKNKSE